MNNVLFESQKVQPSKVVCIGRNYADHISELNNEVPSEPVIFIKPNSAVSDQLTAGNDAPYHYEGEIALLIRGGQAVGVGFGLDLTNRQLQSKLKEKGLPWERAKAFDGAAVFSPFVPLPGGFEQLRLELEINGVLAQAGGYPLMMYKPEFLLKEIQQTFSLEDNDIVMTGTPKGVGEFKTNDRLTGRVCDGEQLLIEETWTAA